MARLDLARDSIVVRIVYDGTALSGKTTTLRALGTSLAREVETPAEAQGRTLYFDWLDYTGGRFDGHSIRCQVVSVPGQAALDRRRRALLADADAVVFVADTSPEGYDRSLAALRESFTAIARRRPAVGLVVQANQRDRPDAVPIARIRADCAALSENLGVTESAAIDGLGVRETFVFAVRLALDRVRELQQSGLLAVGPPEIDGASALLLALQDGERVDLTAQSWRPAVGADRTPVAESRAVAPAGVEAAAPARQTAPWPPDRSVPSGLIWPPIAGRIVLQEATERSLDPVRQSDGSWGCSGDSAWRLQSDLGGLYFDFDEGRAALIDWARTHAVLAPYLSGKRCIVLARAAPGAWRLWQLVFAIPSLKSGLRQVCAEGAPEDVARVLLSVAKRLLDFAPRLAATPLAELGTLERLAVENGLTVYGGLFPSRNGRTAVGRAEESASEVLRRHLAPFLSDFAAAAAWERNVRVVVEVRRQAQERGWSGIGEILCRLLPSA